MKWVWLFVLSLAPAARASEPGFTDRVLRIAESASLFQDDTGFAVDREDWDTSSEVEEGSRGDGKPRGNTDMRVSLRGGGFIPFLDREAAYSGGVGFGAGGEFGIGMSFPTWIRPSLDVGFISADEEKWSGSSTVLLLHGDVGYEWLNSGDLHGSAFLCIGAGFEIFSGKETTAGGEESVSDFNVNLLAGAGGNFGLNLMERLRIDLELRMTFPLGSRNVQGFLLVGVSAAYRF